MSFLGRFTLWGGVKRIGLLITFICLIIIAYNLWTINFSDANPYSVDNAYAALARTGLLLIIMWVVLFILKWILSGFFKK